MRSVEQKDDFLNEVAEATSEDSFDAYMAWHQLRQMLEEGSELPKWAVQYFLNIARVVDDFDPFENDATSILRALHFRHSPELPKRRRKTKLNYDHVYQCISLWQLEDRKKSIGDCIGEYCTKYQTDKNPLDSDTVRSAYYTVRKLRLDMVEQSRPHFRLSGDGT